MRRKSPIQHKVKKHFRKNRSVKSYTRGKGIGSSHLIIRKRIDTKKSMTDSEFYQLMGKIQIHRDKKDFVKFKQEFKKRFNEAKWIYRGVSFEEYIDLKRTKISIGKHFTLDLDIAKSWARGDDNVIKIRKPKSATMKDYDINSLYLDELEVFVPKGTKILAIVRM